MVEISSTFSVMKIAFMATNFADPDEVFHYLLRSHYGMLQHFSEADARIS